MGSVCRTIAACARRLHLRNIALRIFSLTLSITCCLHCRCHDKKCSITENQIVEAVTKYLELAPERKDGGGRRKGIKK